MCSIMQDDTVVVSHAANRDKNGGVGDAMESILRNDWILCALALDEDQT